MAVEKLLCVLTAGALCLFAPVFLKTSSAQEYSKLLSGFDFDAPVMPVLAPDDFMPLLQENRTLQSPRTVGRNTIDYAYMLDTIESEVDEFNQLPDPYDDPAAPAAGYAWDLKIFHPGETAGMLADTGVPYPVIIFCHGQDGSLWVDELDWLGAFFAEQGYVFVIPDFILNYSESQMPSTIQTAVYAFQVSQTLDILEGPLSDLYGWPEGIMKIDQAILIGHSVGGFVAQQTAALDSRIARIALLSSIFTHYDKWPPLIVDTKDVCDIINRTIQERDLALHVQRMTKPVLWNLCPEQDPVCDWIPPVDGFLTQIDLSQDPWEPYLCNGVDCGERTGTYYNYVLFKGRKQTAIANNCMLDHSGFLETSASLETGKHFLGSQILNFLNEMPLQDAGPDDNATLSEENAEPIADENLCVGDNLRLSFFRARPASNKVILEWETESEDGITGFNLYRAESRSGIDVKINDGVISSKGSMSEGASYEFIDDSVRSRQRYRFVLEAVDTRGASVQYGPVAARPRTRYPEH